MGCTIEGDGEGATGLPKFNCQARVVHMWYLMEPESQANSICSPFPHPSHMSAQGKWSLNIGRRALDPEARSLSPKPYAPGAQVCKGARALRSPRAAGSPQPRPQQRRSAASRRLPHARVPPGGLGQQLRCIAHGLSKVPTRGGQAPQLPFTSIYF